MTRVLVKPSTLPHLPPPFFHKIHSIVYTVFYVPVKDHTHFGKNFRLKAHISNKKSNYSNLRSMILRRFISYLISTSPPSCIVKLPSLFLLDNKNFCSLGLNVSKIKQHTEMNSHTIDQKYKNPHKTPISLYRELKN